MSANVLLARLEGVRRTGDGRYRARCPVHGSRGGTLAIKEEANGTILIHCHALCPPLEILNKIGLEFSDLFAEIITDQTPRSRVKRAWRSGDVIDALQFELRVAWVILSDVANGKTLSEQDRERAGIARERIERFMVELGNAH